VYDRVKLMNSILLVDDEKEAVEALKMFFDLRGTPCWVAGNSDEALKIVSEQKPDLVLLDITLQGSRLTGFQVLQEAKKLHPAVKIFMVTGYSDDASHAKAKELGADGYLEKPLSAEKILQTLQG